MTENRRHKVLLIGWDAADWKVISPLMDQGLMPHLERFVGEGVMGNLATLDPPYSPILWTSIATGKRPFKHGVHGFQEPIDKPPGIRPVMGTTRTCKAIWNILTQRGYKTHVVGWWPSHPAEPINGISISDLFQRAPGRLYEPWPSPPGAVHPAELTEHFESLRIHPEELTANHLGPFVPDAKNLTRQQQARLFAVARETAQAATLHAAFTNIIRTQEWDFAALYLASIDHYCHGFMRFHPPKRPHIPQPDFDVFKDVVNSAYRFHDMMLGRLLALAGPDTTVVLISDHGFQPDHLRPRDIPREPAGPAYEHSPYGIFVMKGPGIRKDERIYGASLLDVAPTLLARFGLPIGEDMDGRVLVQAFEDDINIETIPSWEKVDGDTGMHPSDQDDHEDAAALVTEQLVELGYIEAPGKNVEQNQKNARHECEFNLARAYLHAGRPDDALPILEKLYEEEPDTSRYAFRLATVYQALGKLKDCRRVIDEMREKEFFNEPTLDVIEGSLLLGERQPIKAIQLFKKAEKKVSAHQSRINLQLARGYLMLGRFEDAETAIQAELDIDPHHAVAWEHLGQVLLSDHRYEEAVDALLTAVGLEYEMPAAHFHLGDALYNLGDYERAADAFEVCLVMAPGANQARVRLVELYRTHLEDEERAAAHEAEFDDAIKGTITVVSGLPRSGTSMMMQMLDKGGLEPFTDGKRDPDDNNPRGYYEHEAVKSLARNKQWLPQADGKAVKVVANLLTHLPAQFNYRVVFMERDIHEIVSSQKKMLKRMGKPVRDEVYPYTLAQQFENAVEKARQWASRQPNVQILYVPYTEVVENPFGQALRVAEFLGYEVMPELMAQAVDPELRRERVGQPKA